MTDQSYAKQRSLLNSIARKQQRMNVRNSIFDKTRKIMEQPQLQKHQDPDDYSFLFQQPKQQQHIYVTPQNTSYRRQMTGQYPSEEKKLQKKNEQEDDFSFLLQKPQQLQKKQQTIPLINKPVFKKPIKKKNTRPQIKQKEQITFPSKQRNLIIQNINQSTIHPTKKRLVIQNADQHTIPSKQRQFKIQNVQKQSIQPSKIHHMSEYSKQLYQKKDDQSYIERMGRRKQIFQKKRPQQFPKKLQIINVHQNIVQPTQQKIYGQQKNTQSVQQMQIQNAQFKTRVPNLTINVDRKQPKFCYIGYQFYGINTQFYIHRFVHIRKQYLSLVIKLYHELKYQQRLPVMYQLKGAGILLIKDVYKGKVIYGIRHYNYYQNVAQPTRIGINLQETDMKIFIQDLILYNQLQCLSLTLHLLTLNIGTQIQVVVF